MSNTDKKKQGRELTIWLRNRAMKRTFSNILAALTASLFCFVVPSCFHLQESFCLATHPRTITHTITIDSQRLRDRPQTPKRTNEIEQQWPFRLHSHSFLAFLCSYVDGRPTKISALFFTRALVVPLWQPKSSPGPIVRSLALHRGKIFF